MITAGFLNQKFRKRHEFVVEEAEELSLNDYLEYLAEKQNYSGPPPPKRAHHASVSICMNALDKMRGIFLLDLQKLSDNS